MGVAFFLIVLLWTSYRRAVVRGSLATGTSSRLKPLRALLGVAVLAVAGALAVALVPAIAGAGDRDNLRAAMEPPIDLEQYASPLQACPRQHHRPPRGHPAHRRRRAGERGAAGRHPRQVRDVGSVTPSHRWTMRRSRPRRSPGSASGSQTTPRAPTGPSRSPSRTTRGVVPTLGRTTGRRVRRRAPHRAVGELLLQPLLGHRP